jgi:hypothetical protein
VVGIADPLAVLEEVEELAILASIKERMRIRIKGIFIESSAGPHGVS